MKNKKVAWFFFLLAMFIFAAITSRGFAAQDTMDVNITINATSEITVLPYVINWTDVSLGATAGNKSVSVENTGSVNVTNLYVYGDGWTDEIVRPYGLDNASNYSAAAVIAINNVTGERYFYVGRIEWNWTELIQNLNMTNVNSPVSWGFFKNTTNEYVWSVGNGTGGLCNNTGTQFYIEADIDQGIMETRTPDIAGTPNFWDADYTYFSVGSGILSDYCIAVNRTCERIYIYKYDKRSGSINTTQCTNSKHITTSQVTPGTKIQIETNVFMPRGIPAGEMKRATLTFVAT